MGGICQGEELQMTGLMPDWMEEAGKDIMGYLRPKIGEGATPLPEGFPLTSPVDPLSLGGANIMSQFMGGGQYNQPPPGTFDFQMPGAYTGVDGETTIGDGDWVEEFDPGTTISGDIVTDRPPRDPITYFENPPDMGGPPNEPIPPILPPNIIQPPQVLPPEYMGGTSLPPFTHPAQPPSIIGQQYPIQQPNIGSFPWG
jgi:hypothetical protein